MPKSMGRHPTQGCQAKSLWPEPARERRRYYSAHPTTAGVEIVPDLVLEPHVLP